MNTNITLRKGSWLQLNERRAARTGRLLVLLLLTLPAVVQAQFTYTITNGTVTITGYTGPGGAVTIPDTVNGLPVTSIGRMSFYLCTNLTQLAIGTNVTNIGDDAFSSCMSLTNLMMGNNVTSIGSFAFASCRSLTNVVIPNSLTSLEDGVFYGCFNLTSAAIPTNVTSIGTDAFYDCYSLTSVTIPDTVTSIGEAAFFSCLGVTNVTIGNSVTNIGGSALANCERMTSLTIGNRVTSIGMYAFETCGFTNVTIPESVNYIGDYAFEGCDPPCIQLKGVYFKGNAPSLGGTNVFSYANNATIYYLPGTTGWGTTYGGRPTALWPPPTIQRSPQTQTAEAGSAVGLRVKASSLLPLFYSWYLNATNLLSYGTNCQLDLPSVQLAQSGAYTVMISNVLGAVTSAPAMLNVIAPVERRPVPGVKVTGESAGLWNVDYADSLSPAPNWTPLGSVTLTGSTGYCCDPTLPLPPERFYRAWQAGTPGVMPSLDLHLVPAITLTGSIGHSVRLDYINQFGPIDAWITLATVPLTNTSQLYFDISAPGQPPRLYRLVPSP